MRRLIFCFLFLTAVAGAQNYIPSPSTPRLMNEKGYISDTNPLPVATLSDSGSVLASETIGLLDAIGEIKDAVTPLDREPKVHLTQKITLAPNTAQTVSSALSGGLGQKTRLYIEVTTMNKDDEFWFNMGGHPAVIGETRRVVGGIGMELPRLTTFSLIASEAMDLFILEAGR